MTILHSSDYPDFFLSQAPEYFRAALHVYATASREMERPLEQQLADVRMLEGAMGEQMPPSELGEFHRSCLLLFYNSLIKHYEVYGYRYKYSM